MQCRSHCNTFFSGHTGWVNWQGNAEVMFYTLLLGQQQEGEVSERVSALLPLPSSTRCADPRPADGQAEPRIHSRGNRYWGLWKFHQKSACWIYTQSRWLQQSALQYILFLAILARETNRESWKWCFTRRLWVSNKMRRRGNMYLLCSLPSTRWHPLCQPLAHIWASRAWDTWWSCPLWGMKVALDYFHLQPDVKIPAVRYSLLTVCI